MTVRLTSLQAIAVQKIERQGQGSEVRTFMPRTADVRTFRALEREGYCRFRDKSEPGVDYDGFELTDKGRDFLKGRRV